MGRSCKQANQMNAGTRYLRDEPEAERNAGLKRNIDRPKPVRGEEEDAAIVLEHPEED